nr:dehydrogenase [Saprospiraceae bacterium]
MAIPFRILPLIVVLLLINSCSEHTQEPPPPLTYSGDKPRIQDPLSPEQSQKHIQLPKGFTAKLFAAEPNIINPIAMAWDERGRLWVIQSQDYPHKLENEVGGDRITICEDTDGDGKADKFIDFATNQSLSTGLVIVKGGAIVAQAPDMVLLQDTDGDDVMDERKVLFGGFGIWDTHAGPSNLHYGIDNQIWGAVGYSGFEQTFGGKLVNFTRGVYRFTRDGKSFEPIGQFNNNTWGCGITADNEIFGSTANNNHACYIGIPLRYYGYLGKRPSWAINADFIQGHYEITPVDTVPLQQVDVRGGYTAAAGANFYTASNYPAEYRNQMYVNAPTGHLVHLARMKEDGAGYQEVDGGNIFASTDAWTAPVFTETGPDGNLWVADWYNPVIQHNPDVRGMPNQIWNANKGPGNAHLNTNRDVRHGRIYIVKYRGKSDNSITELTADKEDNLLKALDHDNMFWRT